MDLYKTGEQFKRAWKRLEDSAMNPRDKDLVKMFIGRLRAEGVGSWRLIKYIFSEFSSKESIGSTGASKILHILNPHVFMMWDDKIGSAYHKLHRRDHKEEDPECYLEFLKQSQDMVRALLSKRTEEGLWSEHLTFLDKSFMEAFSFKESILKMLGECNYVRFTLNMELWGNSRTSHPLC